LHPTDLLVVRYTGLPRAEEILDQYDAVVYNLGDHYPYHAPVFEMSQRVPGIVVLHDYVMHHFFAEYCERHRKWDWYAAAMKHRYGADLRLTADGWTGEAWRAWERPDAVRYPLFEEAIAGCRGVVAHAEFVRDAVARTVGVPVVKIPLAYSVDRVSPVFSRADLQIPEGRKLAVTVGHVNENKRSHAVLQAMAADRRLAETLFYVVVGDDTGAFAGRLKALCEDWKLQDSVRFTGTASESLLRSYLANADFCINLRLPAMEGGSASCVEQMLFGKPVIVTDTGVYRELPDSSVRKVRPEHEAEDLACCLKDLAGGENLRREFGEAGRRYAETVCAPESYAAQFLEFCTGNVALRPTLELAAAAAGELRRMGATAEMGIVGTVSRESALLMGFDCDPPLLRDEKP
jgi:glycosyltransferase involved in cell wall biosynthesis